MVVGDQLPDREDLQFLICHRVPGANTHSVNFDFEAYNDTKLYKFESSNKNKEAWKSKSNGFGTTAMYHTRVLHH